MPTSRFREYQFLIRSQIVGVPRGMENLLVRTVGTAGRCLNRDNRPRSIANDRWLHSALGYLRPADYYRGQPEELHAAWRTKLCRARYRRRETNLKLRQPTLPLEDNHRAP